ncbi:MAG: glycerophosphodiester phosphodiesterase [Chloroflexi bacterium]|nr:glycerophosphodiester phosphodiesterase [Chloroflexota bacterium]
MQLVFLALLIWGAILWWARQTRPAAPLIIAHRGASAYAPENTLAALHDAIQREATWLEVDVRQTADQIPVLLHDRSVNRTTDGVGTVDKLTLDHLQQLDAGSHFSRTFSGEHIPTLSAVLQLLEASPAVNLLMEVKEPARYPDLGMRIAEAIRAHQLAERVIVMSFDGHWLQDFQNTAPDIQIGCLGFDVKDEDNLENAVFANIHWTRVLMTPWRFRKLKSDGHQVLVWTVDNLALMRLLLWMGVDGITTNRPDILSIDRL